MKRFFDKIEKTEYCWNWTGYITNSGYGQFRYNGATKRAHRVSYEIINGIIGSDMVIDHLCKNKKCVNPEHLEAVTQAENVRRGLAGKINNPQSLKQTCPRKHLYSGVDKNGARICHRCKVIRQTEYKKRNAIASARIL